MMDVQSVEGKLKKIVKCVIYQQKLNTFTAKLLWNRMAHAYKS